MFNLNEDEEGEELTHYGQSLSQIEKFENPEQSDSDDDDVERGLFGKSERPGDGGQTLTGMWEGGTVP